jgi:hypothetical protein
MRCVAAQVDIRLSKIDADVVRVWELTGDLDVNSFSYLGYVRSKLSLLDCSLSDRAYIVILRNVPGGFIRMNMGLVVSVQVDSCDSV